MTKRTVVSVFKKKIFFFGFWVHCSQKNAEDPGFPLLQVSTPNRCRMKNGTKVPLVARGDIAGISLFFLHPLFTSPPTPDK
jgi:hypothetical protein